MEKSSRTVKGVANAAKAPKYKNPALPAEVRAADLLSRIRSSTPTERST
jgi:hypothetical protein